MSTSVMLTFPRYGRSSWFTANRIAAVIDGATKMVEGCLIHPGSWYTHIPITIAAISGRMTSVSSSMTEAATMSKITAMAMLEWFRSSLSLNSF